MAFNGTFDAPELTPSAFGLFSIIAPKTHTSDDGSVDDRWVRGISVIHESEPTLTRNWGDGTDDVLSESDATDRFIEVTPFYIEVEDNASTFGSQGDDRFKSIIRQVEAVTEKHVEHEFWEGTIATGEDSPTPFLRGSTCVTLNSGTALSPDKALALLEFSIGETSPAGEAGNIHMTRDVAAILGSKGLLRFEGGTVQTVGGTPVAIGSGYTGTGPISAGAPVSTLDSRWMYATGTIGIHLGKPEVVNDTLAQAYDVSGNKNELKIKANRPAAAYFDPSIHLAVKVNLA